MQAYYQWHLWDLQDYSVLINMENYSEYILPVLILALLSAGWMMVQLVAKKIGTKNHIDNDGSCCGACDKKDSCDKPETILKISK